MFCFVNVVWACSIQPWMTEWLPKFSSSQVARRAKKRENGKKWGWALGWRNIWKKWDRDRDEMDYGRYTIFAISIAYFVKKFICCCINCCINYKIIVYKNPNTLYGLPGHLWPLPSNGASIGIAFPGTLVQSVSKAFEQFFPVPQNK